MIPPLKSPQPERKSVRNGARQMELKTTTIWVEEQQMIVMEKKNQGQPIKGLEYNTKEFGLYPMSSREPLKILTRKRK